MELQSRTIEKIAIATLATKKIYLHVEIPENFKYVDQEHEDKCIEYVPKTDLEDLMNVKALWNNYSEVISIRKPILGTTTAAHECELFYNNLKLMKTKKIKSVEELLDEKCDKEKIDHKSVEIIKRETIDMEFYQKKALIVSYTYNQKPEVAYVCFYSNGAYHMGLAYAIVCNIISKQQALGKLLQFESKNISRYFESF